MRLLTLLPAAALALTIAACSSSDGASSDSEPAPAAGLPPGDHFFDSAGATTGSEASPGGTVRVGVMLFDPAYAANHPSGKPGADASMRAAYGRIVTDKAVVDVTGSWTTDGAVTLEGSGWSLTGQVSGAVVAGKYQGPAGSGLFAGADVVLGEVAVSFGTSGGNAVGVVVSKTGEVTGVLGGPTGGYLNGKASGNSLSYSWQANGSSGTGTGSASAGGQISGAMQASGSCAASSWACDIGTTSCVCEVTSGAPEAGYTTPSKSDACSSSCCFTGVKAGVYYCKCEGSSSACVATNHPNYENFTVVPSCPGALPPSASGCSKSWQTAPAPCTAMMYSLKPGQVVAMGTPIACPGPFADLSGTCAGGNLDACVPPPGGCPAPANGGCRTCGKITSCSLF